RVSVVRFRPWPPVNKNNDLRPLTILDFRSVRCGATFRNAARSASCHCTQHPDEKSACRGRLIGYPLISYTAPQPRAVCRDCVVKLHENVSSTVLDCYEALRCG